jgi:hypothetical protein
LKKRQQIALAFLAGFSAVYILKYVIFGLEQWDKMLHPERLTVDVTGPSKRFAKPLLGLFSGG